MTNINFELRVFLSYAKRFDKPAVQNLHARLTKDGFENVWFDEKSLLPGQDWEAEIESAVRKSDVIIVCLSSKSIASEGYVHKEIKLALDVADRQPEGTIYIIPVRFEECDVPRSLSKLHWTDIFSDDGYEKLLKSLQAREKQIAEKQALASNIHSSFHSKGKKFRARRYRVGKIETDVYMDLLGGGDQWFDRTNLTFDYKHEWMPLPELIEKDREPSMAAVEKEAKEKGHILFNGPAIRLHSFDLNVVQSKNGKEEKNPVLHLRPTCWHDFVLTNRRLDEKIQGDLTIRDLYADEDKLVTKRNVDWIELTNILCITVVMLTSDNYTLLGRRTERVDNSSGIFAASAAENMHRWKDEPSLSNDLWSTPKSLAGGSSSNVNWDYAPSACPNPFFAAWRGIREEIAEEVAKSVNVDDIKFLSLAWNLPNFQPHLYAFVQVGMKMDELDRILDAGRGDDSWESNLLPVKFEPSGPLKDILFNEKWAEISKGAVLRSLVHVYGYEEVNKALS